MNLMSLLTTALAALVATLTALPVKTAVEALTAAKDKEFNDYHDKVKAAYTGLVDAITKGDLEAVSTAAETFEALIEDGTRTLAANTEAAPALVEAVVTQPTDAPPTAAPEELGSSNQPESAAA